MSVKLSRKSALRFLLCRKLSMLVIYIKCSKEVSVYLKVLNCKC